MPDNIKKDPSIKPGVFFSFSLMKYYLAHHNHIGCLWAFGTVGNLELYLVAFIEGFKSFSLNGREVNEDIISIVSRNEPVTLLLIKPFYFAFGHYNSPPFFF